MFSSFWITNLPWGFKISRHWSLKSLGFYANHRAFFFRRVDSAAVKFSFGVRGENSLRESCGNKKTDGLTPEWGQEDGEVLSLRKMKGYLQRKVLPFCQAAKPPSCAWAVETTTPAERLSAFWYRLLFLRHPTQANIDENSWLLEEVLYRYPTIPMEVPAPANMETMDTRKPYKNVSKIPPLSKWLICLCLQPSCGCSLVSLAVCWLQNGSRKNSQEASRGLKRTWQLSQSSKSFLIWESSALCLF